MLSEIYFLLLNIKNFRNSKTWFLVRTQELRHAAMPENVVSFLKTPKASIRENVFRNNTPTILFWSAHPYFRVIIFINDNFWIFCNTKLFLTLNFLNQIFRFFETKFFWTQNGWIFLTQDFWTVLTHIFFLTFLTQNFPIKRKLYNFLKHFWSFFNTDFGFL